MNTHNSCCLHRLDTDDTEKEREERLLTPFHASSHSTCQFSMPGCPIKGGRASPRAPGCTFSFSPLSTSLGSATEALILTKGDQLFELDVPSGAAPRRHLMWMCHDQDAPFSLLGGNGSAMTDFSILGTIQDISR